VSIYYVTGKILLVRNEDLTFSNLRFYLILFSSTLKNNTDQEVGVLGTCLVQM